MGLDRGTQQAEVPLDGRSHRGVVLLLERCTAVDVGEEEGDGAGGEIGHRPSPKVLAWRNLGWIVAWSIIRDVAQRVLDCSWTEDR